MVLWAAAELAGRFPMIRSRTSGRYSRTLHLGVGIPFLIWTAALIGRQSHLKGSPSVRGGAMNGVEGVFLSKTAASRVISVDAIHRSMPVRIDGYDVEPVCRCC